MRKRRNFADVPHRGNVHQNLQDVPHGERDVLHNFQDDVHESAIFDSGMNFLVDSRSSENGDICTTVN